MVNKLAGDVTQEFQVRKGNCYEQSGWLNFLSRCVP